MRAATVAAAHRAGLWVMHRPGRRTQSSNNRLASPTSYVAGELDATRNHAAQLSNHRVSPGTRFGRNTQYAQLLAQPPDPGNARASRTEGAGHAVATAQNIKGQTAHRAPRNRQLLVLRATAGISEHDVEPSARVPRERCVNEMGRHDSYHQ
jgi:hypothetical protein